MFILIKKKLILTEVKHLSSFGIKLKVTGQINLEADSELSKVDEICFCSLYFMLIFRIHIHFLVVSKKFICPSSKVSGL